MLPIDTPRYGYPRVTVLRWLPSVLLLLPWLLGPAAPSNAARIRDLAAPSSFHLLDWETVNVGERLDRLWAGLTTSPNTTQQSDVEAVKAYFRTRARRPELRAATEPAIERLVAQAYLAAGLAQSRPVPIPGLFPPVLVALTPPPNVLVLAPRTELRVIGSSVLQAMDTAAQEQLEASADSTGVSSLVAPIGGLATYPSMVLDDPSPQRVLASVAHEWMHQYLIFFPLGTGYWNSQQTREINETTAEMVGQEVGTQLTTALGLRGPRAAQAPAAQTGFDFPAFMRATRLEVERLLASGNVDGAEGYMRTQRDVLDQHGYRIRKLNQAYFALYGSYGEGFAASPANPIAGLLHALRDKSTSLGDFVIRVRTITTIEQLRAAAR
jgi:hypothetical protein